MIRYAQMNGISINQCDSVTVQLFLSC